MVVADVVTSFGEQPSRIPCMPVEDPNGGSDGDDC
jgi:hypothetical protein